MNDGNETDEIVSFPVPKKYLTIVIRALANAIDSDTALASSSAAYSGGQAFPWPIEPRDAYRTLTWNEDNMKTLRSRLRAQAAIVLLNLAADRPNERVYFSEIVKKSGRDHSHASADLGVMTKTIKKQF